MPDISSTAMLPAQIKILDAMAPYLSAIEGPNEVDVDPNFSWNGQTGYAAEVSYQQALFAAVKADPLLSSLPVYNFTLAGDPNGYNLLGNLSSVATDGNAHIYYPAIYAPTMPMRYALGVVAPATLGIPTVITETNYATAPTLGGVSNPVQASYVMDLLMDATKQGVGKTFLYELLDDTPDPNFTNLEDHWGLFNADGTPKPSAVALHNLTSILADGGATATSFTTGKLAYTVTGLPASGDTLLLEKSDGAYDLTVWAEPTLWNATTDTAIAATPRTVDVKLAVPANVSMFDPLTGTTAIAQYNNTSDIVVTITDHPVILEVTPATPVVVAVSVSGLVGVTSSNPAHQGQVITFTLATSAAVVVSTSGGVPALTLSSGISAIYDAANSNAKTLAFTTTIAAGQSSPDLQVTGLTLNGASITDLAGNPLTTLGVSSMADANTNIVVSTATPTVLLGTGPDTLVLNVSEDAYQGDAQFTISVDGTQVGGTQTALALNGAGVSQAFDIKGTFGAGPHVASVNFLNGLSAGIPSTARDLYVSSASVDGQAISGAALTEITSGPVQFSFGVVAAPLAPAITGLNPASDTGWTATDGVTDITIPTVVGTAQAATTVTLFDGGKLVGTGVTAADGVWAVTSSVLPQGANSLTAVATNATGQASPGSTAFMVTINDTPPVVSAITSATSSGPAHQGQVITFTLTTIESLAVSMANGSPTLALSSGGIATYDAAHSNANTLAFTTTIAAGQSSGDLQVTGLALNGASITDLAGNALSTLGVSSLAGANTGIAVSTATPTTVIGTGPDTLALSMTEDAYLGDAQFTVSVDGVQIGGTQTAVAVNGAGTPQVFDVQGDFGPGQHVATVDFLNDRFGGAGLDLNLYVVSSKIDGQSVSGGQLFEFSSGPEQFSFNNTLVAPTISGLSSASDSGWSSTDGVTNTTTPTITGTAQAATAVTLYDGNVAVGTSQTTSSGTWSVTSSALAEGNHSLTAVATNQAGRASPASLPDVITISDTPPVVSAITSATSSGPAYQGQVITFTLATSEAVAVSTAGGVPSLALSTGGTASYDAAHSAANMLAFTTTTAAGQSSADLLVTGLSLNGASIADLAGNTLSTAGVSSLIGANTGIAVSTATPTVVLGSGSDTIALNVTEDAYMGDAQFTVSLDGVQVGGVQTAVATRSGGSSQEFDINSTLSPGQHVVTVDFLNDLWAGTPQTDRNLFVTSTTVDGQAIANGALNEYGDGPQQIAFMTPPAPTAIAVLMSEDAWTGDAAYRVTVDGQQLGSGTVTYLHSVGQVQAVRLQDVLSPGAHDLGVSLVNAANGGSPTTERNLYVEGLYVDGTPYPSAKAALYANGTDHFQIMVPKS